MEKVIIFGTGAMAKMAYYFFDRDQACQVEAFTVEETYNTEEAFLGLKVVNFEEIEKTYPPSKYKMFVALGPTRMNQLREEFFIKAKEKGYNLFSYISKSAICNSKLGENCFVGDLAVINPFVEIGDNNYFYEHVVLSNESTIKNHCYLSPKSAVGTFSIIGNNCILGTSAVIKTSVILADKTLVGATSYISADTEEEGVYGEKNSQLYGCISTKIDISK